MVAPLNREALIRASGRSISGPPSGSLSARGRHMTLPIEKPAVLQAEPPRPHWTPFTRHCFSGYRSILFIIVAFVVCAARLWYSAFSRSHADVEPANLSWEQQISANMNLQCQSRKIKSKPYRGRSRRKTALASFMRSGNTYTRTLIERATGIQTSSLYCDSRISSFFAAECEGFKAPWLIKTHWPKKSDVITPLTPDRWEYFDQAINIVRNPIDVAWSLYAFENTSSHTGRVHGLERFGSQDSAALAYIGSRWTRHYAYWTGRVNYPVITVRYEDLVDRPFPELMRILSILLPEEELPSLEQIICAVQGDNWKEAYQSRKESAFHAWSRFDDETRLQYLQLVQEPWCRYGYDQLLTIKTGIQSPILCKSVAAYNRTFAMNSKGQYLDDEQ